MKLLTLTSLYPNSQHPNHGIFIHERMKAWKREVGNELVVVAPVPWFPPININKKWYSYSQIPQDETIEGVKVYHPRYLNIPKIGMVFQGWLMGIAVTHFLEKLKKQYDFNLIDSHYVYPDGVAARMASKKIGRPYVISARGSDINQFPKFKSIKPQIEKVLKDAKKVISVSQSLKDIMSCDLVVSPDKVVVISNGVDTEKFYPIDKAEARRHCGLPLDKKIILSVGNLVPVKNHQLLLDAYQLLENKENIVIVIVGEGPLKNNLLHWIKDQNLEGLISLPGRTSHNELNWWYNAADVFCLTSLTEGDPSVVREALAVGLPIVSTGVGNLSERKSKNIIITKEEKGAYRDAIAHTLENRCISSAVDQSSNIRMQNEVAKELNEVFQNVLGQL